MHHSILFLLVTIVGTNFLSVTNCVTLSRTGTYTLTVAIDPKTQQNANPPDNYIENIKTGIGDLSDLLYYTTNGKFSISSVDILVPDHWNTTSNGFATTQSYAGADIQISHLYQLPYVNNPNPCALPGVNIQLPYNFFDEDVTGPYGRLGKALLNQFVRFRFGAWEEHGFPGDQRFPYFWLPLNASTWEVNTCTDKRIDGVYKKQCTETNNEICSDLNDPLYPPKIDCRFCPNNTQVAQSSLMSYYWLPSMESFCNFVTHNRETPTPQNLYCKYWSVLETIEKSADFNFVTETHEPDRVEINVVKPSKQPLLYMLLDAGLTQVPVNVLDHISSVLKNITNSDELRNVVAGISKFPADDSLAAVTEVVPWSSIGENLEQFNEALDSTFGISPGIRNYGEALKLTVQDIMSRKHESGGIILIVKTGTETAIEFITPESEVIMAILESNIQIFAIEAQNHFFKLALENVVILSNGLHETLSPESNIISETFIETLKNALSSRVEATNNYQLGMKETLSSDSQVLVDLNEPITGFEAFAIVLAGGLSGSPKLVSSEPGHRLPEVILDPMTEWDTEITNKVYRNSSADFSGDPFDILAWEKVEYSCSGSSCTVLLVILASVESNQTVNHGLEISVLTTATSTSNVVDLSIDNADSVSNVAFGIYAKIQQNGLPIQSVDGLSVTAYMYLQDRSEAWEIELKDNGNVLPDVSVNDGYFSSVFFPEKDGVYRLTVIAKYNGSESSSTFQYSSIQPSAGKLFPIDQSEIGCGGGYQGCWTNVPESNFVLSYDYTSPITVINSEQYKPIVDRIFNLRATPINDYVVILEWTTPGYWYPFYQPGSYIQADFYEIKQSDNIDNLLYNWENAENVPALNEYPGPPGYEHSLEYRAGNPYIRFFGIKTLSQNNMDGPHIVSNIAYATFHEIVPTTTPGPSTVTTRPSTTQTTYSSTVSTTSTTQPSTTTTGSTTPRTTPKITTTPRPTTTLTTPRSTTTVPPSPTTEEPPKHWYQETEGQITLAVFGVGVVVIVIGGVAFIWYTKFRR